MNNDYEKNLYYNPKKNYSQEALISLIASAIGIFLGGLFAIAGGIVGLYFCKKAETLNDVSTIKTIGKVLSIVALVIGVISIIMVFVLLISMMAVNT